MVLKRLGKKRSYLERLILSEIVAHAVEWEIRRKMQLELFKKREIGYALNQVRVSLGKLFQEDRGYLLTVSKMI